MAWLDGGRSYGYDPLDRFSRGGAEMAAVADLNVMQAAGELLKREPFGWSVTLEYPGFLVLTRSDRPGAWIVGAPGDQWRADHYHDGQWGEGQPGTIVDIPLPADVDDPRLVAVCVAAEILREEATW